MASLYVPGPSFHYLSKPWANAIPVSGQYLARNHHTYAERGFEGAELVVGIKVLWLPTVLQASAVVRVPPTAVHNALRQWPNRSAIEHRQMPLSPPKRNGGSGNRNGNGNGNRSSSAMLTLDDATVADVIADMVGKIGIEHFKAIASAVVNVSL